MHATLAVEYLRTFADTAAAADGSRAAGSASGEDDEYEEPDVKDEL